MAVAPPVSPATSGSRHTARGPALSAPGAGPPLHPQHALQTWRIGLLCGVCCWAGICP